VNRGRERGDDSDVESIAAAEGARADETADAEGVEVLELLDELRTIAQNGVTYAEDPYDRERYERILDLTSEYYGRTLDAPAEEMRGRLRGEAGYVSAKVGASVAVFDDADRILLMRRADGGGWALPGGYVDPNESSSEAAVREAREETGLDVEPVELVGTFDLPAGAGGNPHSVVTVLYRCRVTGGDLRLSHEGTDLAYRDPSEIPADDWYVGNRAYALHARESVRETR
jgi:ADP-ribose pyrophosphatase YjhB (NUDIX family)